MAQKAKRVKNHEAAFSAPATESPTNSPPYSLPAGLFDFYSSQAKVLLDQYQNINQLLGPTNDWTAPGTLCEVLIRDRIRQMLTSRYSVDKGFIFGRRMKDNKEVHSPEIDIIIHDPLNYAPVYRLEDFVIVYPAAVRGIIQVKRTLTADKLKKAIDNLVDAKEHLKAFRAIHIPNKETDVFCAALFFGDNLTLADGRISTSYKSTIGSLREIDTLARPHFLGSLQNRFYVMPFDSQDRYEGYRSQGGGGSIALVMFLAYLTHYILPSYATPALYRPADVVSDDTIQLAITEEETKPGV